MGLPELGWHLIVLMNLSLYVGNAMKDLVSAPRPLGVSYGAARLAFLGSGTEEATLNAKEYGLPSSHTMNSLCLNFYVVHYLHEVGLLRDAPAVAAYAAVVAWVLWIAASRIYLGLHTPIDIGAGAVAGLATVTTFISLEGALNAWVALSPRVVAASAALVSLILLRLHPRPLNPTPTFEFSTSFMGVVFATLIGVSRHPEFFQPPVSLAVVLAQPWWWVPRRLAAGFALVVACKEASRAGATALLPRLYAFFPLALRRLWQPPKHDECTDGKIENPALKGLPHTAAGRPFDVEVTSRFFAYAGIGFALSDLAPSLFAATGW